jgi:hypothetical protein
MKLREAFIFTVASVTNKIAERRSPGKGLVVNARDWKIREVSEAMEIDGASPSEII